MLADVDLSNLVIAEADIVDAPGWLPLVKAGDVPLVLLGEAEGHRAVYFTFDLTESNLPVQVSYPILGARILRYLGGQDLASQLPGPAGQPIALAPPPGYTTLVTTPSGVTRELPATVGLFDDTTTPGIYRVIYKSDTGEVRPGLTVVRQFVAAESAGASRSIATEPLALAAADSTAVVSEWTWLLLPVLLGLMLIEWWVGHGAPRPHPRRRPRGELA
jgi:Ca-activated chloride channel family protein